MLTQNDEDRLFAAVKEASLLAEGSPGRPGLDPTAAVAKVASDRGYGEDTIRLICHAYNNGAQLDTWQTGKGVLAKLAGFPLADPDAVVAAVYGRPAKEAAARRESEVSPEYALPPAWLGREKRASADPVPFADRYAPREKAASEWTDEVRAALHRKDAKYKEAAEASRAASACFDKLAADFDALVRYFTVRQHATYKTAGYTYRECELAARTYMGLDEQEVLRAAGDKSRASMVKDAVYRTPPGGFDMRAEPFGLIRRVVNGAAEYGRLKEAAAEKKASADFFAENGFRKFTGAYKKAETVPYADELSVVPLARDPGRRARDLFKSAMGFGTEVAAIAAGDVIGQAVHHRVDPLMEQQGGHGGPPEEDDILSDPAADAEIKTIQGRAALDGILADRTGPLSRRPPSEVVSAYNAIAAKNPEAAGDPAKMKPLLESHFGEKTAFDLASAAAGLQLGKAVGSPVKDKGELVDDKWLKLEDPYHSNQLRRIRAHALLTQMMSDSDDPISGHDPDAVLNAYNEIASAAPRIADNPHALRPVLRKKLEGRTEPFEANELLNIEKGMAQAKSPTPSTKALGNAPDNILG